MLSRLSFPELENLGIEKKNFDCAEVVSKYSDMGTDKIEEVLGVVTLGIEADPVVDLGWETNGGFLHPALNVFQSDVLSGLSGVANISSVWNDLYG